MKYYLDVLEHVYLTGKDLNTRNGFRRTVLDMSLRIDLREGFPAITSKKVNIQTAIAEMMWFTSGSSHTAALQRMDGKGNIYNIWKDWSLGGSIGPLYGKQWRFSRRPQGSDVIIKKPEGPDAIAPDMIEMYASYEKFALDYYDQLWHLACGLKYSPEGTRHRLTAMVPALTPDSKLSPQENLEHGRQPITPCHVASYWNVIDGELTCSLTMASSDIPIGLPYNIIGYAYLTHALAHHAGLKVGNLNINLVNAHIYANQLSLVEEQLQHRNALYMLPTLEFSDNFDMFKPDMKDVNVLNYYSHPAIKYPTSV